jgi:DNA-binding transcriptional ArsR family regulator
VLRDTLTPTFRALADPTRRWYLECLLDGEVRLLEFAEMFPISQPTVIHHLRVLDGSGLLSSRKQGPARLARL